MGKEASRKLEWRINVSDGVSERLEPETGAILRAWTWFKRLMLGGFILKICKFLEKAWNLAVDEPKKVIHGLKVGLAISLVSLFYYMRPLYDGVGGNAMWAVMTVVVVFESSVGATLGKCINRAIGTFLAGSLGVGVHWIAFHSGKNLEPIVLGISLFLLASAATFSRFMPTIKARFDYGIMIFILTFSLVSVSGYRVDKLLELAQQRLSTIAIGASICIIISMLFCPMWAGDELHLLICQNLEKLAHSLDECVVEYFRHNKTSTAKDEACSKKMKGYRCALNSKATEELKANFARWEPAHGRFSFRHPWKQYLKIGASIRNCAYCIETLHGCVDSETQAPPHLKRHLNNICMRLSSSSSNVLQELAFALKTMKQSSKINLSVGEMNFAVQELKHALISLPNHNISIKNPSPSTVEASGNCNTEPITSIRASSSFMEILPLATLASLLIENAAKIEVIVNGVNELAVLAEFKPTTDNKKSKSNQSPKKLTSENQDPETVKIPQKV
ncbi:Aluminum-activated malate transporter 10 [Citrus sinensis]|uniref:aluminum-activated malate transporter 10 n=1 Tax=Citrus sinensis TaxID=2711 RepID=UPI0003D758A6|nr:aluminum-activated malate transporter 10 [Citrus sinensis]KAH9731389.1 Aluminum-activated malate transporter 10 [Citrus sinensis]